MHKNMHVRICGSRGGAIPHGHPARATPWGQEHTRVGALKGRDSQGLDMPQSLSIKLVHLFNSMDGMFGVDGCSAPSRLFGFVRRRPRAMSAMPWAAMWLPLWGKA